MQVQGNLSKMSTQIKDDKAYYSLNLGNENIDMNALVGKDVSIKYLNMINCQVCGKKTNK